MVTLKEINKDNYSACINLKVRQEQKNFVATNEYSLAQSKYQPECRPLAIYCNNEMVGFIMHGIDSDDDNHWIWRLMVDKSYQSKGYGTQAMKLLIDRICEDKSRDKILISYEQDNKKAEALYHRLGFIHTQLILDGEKVMQYNY